MDRGLAADKVESLCRGLGVFERLLQSQSPFLGAHGFARKRRFQVIFLAAEGARHAAPREVEHVGGNELELFTKVKHPTVDDWLEPSAARPDFAI